MAAHPVLATPRVEPRLRSPVAVPTSPVVGAAPAVGSAIAQERHRAVPRVPPRRMPARRARFSRLLAPVATIAFALAAVTWASEQTPPLTPVADPGPSTTVATPRAVVPTTRATTVPTPQGSGSGVVGAPKRAARATPSGSAAAPRIAPVRRGGYVFSSGRLLVAATGRSLERVELAEFCSRAITISRLPITARGTFAYSGPALGGFRVDLSGRFLDARRIRLDVVLRGPGCPARRVTAVGRLS